MTSSINIPSIMWTTDYVTFMTNQAQATCTTLIPLIIHEIIAPASTTVEAGSRKLQDDYDRAMAIVDPRKDQK